MKTLLAFAAINAVFIGANVVAAGVTQVLGGLVLAAMPEARDDWWPWAFVMAAALACALAFLAGTVRAALALHSPPRRGPTRRLAG